MSSQGSILDTTHESNRIFFNAFLLVDDDNNNSTIARPPSVTVQVLLTRKFVPDNINLSQISYDEGLGLHNNQVLCTFPLRVFNSAEDARPIFEEVVSNYVTHARFNGEQLRWGGPGDNEGGRGDRLQGFDDAVDRLSETAASIVHEAVAAGDDDDDAVESLTILVSIFKRTVVEAELFGELEPMFLAHGDEDGDCQESEFLELEMVKYDGGDEDLECAICLREVLSGTRVARLPCAHRFHENCIVPWVEKSQTCPLCRFYVG